MEFKDKLKTARQDAQMTQKQLAKAADISLRAVQFYESGDRNPQSAAIVLRLAEALHVRTNYFLSDEDLEQMKAQDAFLDEAKKQYGSKGKGQARQIIEQATALFAGGDLNEEDQEAFFEAMTEIYFDAKKKAKKYAPKRGRQQ